MELEHNWGQKSLENLEKKKTGEPDTEYNLANKVLRLRKVPLNQFSVEDLRLMIGQKAGLPYLITLSLDILKDDLFADGDLFPGDLLQNILKVPASFWKEHRELWEKIHVLIKDKIEEVSEHNISVQAFYDAGI